jgi:predicted AAA+ superfamily ATPase
VAKKRQPAFLDRHAMTPLRNGLSDFRVVVVNGPRQSGKTVLLGQLHEQIGGTSVTFDDPEMLEAAKSDPVGFVGGFVKPLLIDEVQRAGDPLLLAIKAHVDRDPTPGQFVLTGSTRFLTVPTLSESLAGRALIIDLWPFSQGEIARSKDSFVDAVFENPRGLLTQTPYRGGRAACFRRVCLGGFPEVIKKRSAQARTAWFGAYVRTVTQRDIKEISRIRQAAELPRLLRLLAGISAQELNVARLAARVGLDDQTLHNYLPLLETVYLVHRIPGWSRNLTSKVKRRPKIYLADTGLASHLLRVNPDALAHPTSPASGPLLETFVLNELVKQRTWSERDVDLYHFKDRDGAEVDLIIEAFDGRVVALEVKAAQSVAKGDFRWLELLREKLGSQFAYGAVLYTGSRAIPFGDRLSALPIPALWESETRA